MRRGGMRRLRMFAFLSLGLLAAARADVAAAAPAPARKPITHETLWMMKRVGAPTVSPTASGWCTPCWSRPTSPRTRRSATCGWCRRRLGAAAADHQHQGSRRTVSPGRPTAAHRLRHQARRRRGRTDLRPGPGRGRRGAPADQPFHRRRRPAVAAGRQGDPVQSRVYPGALDDEANKKIAAERKERKYNLRRLRAFPGALLERVARRAPADHPGAIARAGLDAEGHPLAHGARAHPGLLRARRPTPASRWRRCGAPTAARSCSWPRPSAGTRPSPSRLSPVSHAARRAAQNRARRPPPPGELRERRLQPRRQVRSTSNSRRRTRRSTTWPGCTEWRGPPAARPRS